MTPSILFAAALEQLGAAFGFFVGLDRAVLAGFRPEHDHVDSGRLQNLNHFFAAGLGEVIGEEAAIPYDQTHRHLGVSHGRSRLTEVHRTGE